MRNNQFVKDKLNAIIEDMAIHKETFVKNPDKDFVRNRKITFGMLKAIKITFISEGNSF